VVAESGLERHIGSMGDLKHEPAPEDKVGKPVYEAVKGACEAPERHVVCACGRVEAVVPTCRVGSSEKCGQVDACVNGWEC
jgi:hypothetical protein